MTAIAELRGRVAAGSMVSRTRPSASISAPFAVKRSPASGPGRSVAASEAAGAIRISPRMFRTAVTRSMTAVIWRSASGLRSFFDGRGYGASMIDSPLCGSRCQISSVMTGMNGCRSRRVESAQIRKDQARGVPDLVGEVPVALDALLGDPDVATLSERRQREAEGVGPILLHDHERVGDVALRLGHLLAFGVAHDRVQVD